MAEARAYAPNILNRYLQKMVTIKQQRWNQLQQKQRKKAVKEDKQVASRAKLKNNVTAQGGVWCTEEMVNSKLMELNRKFKKDEEITHALLHTQLQFHQNVLKSKVQQKECFNLTTSIGGTFKNSPSMT